MADSLLILDAIASEIGKSFDLYAKYQDASELIRIKMLHREELIQERVDKEARRQTLRLDCCEVCIKEYL
jgi:hypothetical protein